jgi:hypothetical protein
MEEGRDWRKSLVRAKVAIYIEGGGDSRALQEPLKRGFRKLFGKAILNNNDLAIITSGGRGQTYKDFKTAFEQDKHDFVVLLLDSEGAVPQNQRAWAYFTSGTRPNDATFLRPKNATDDNAHLMVQMMEAWFITDVEAFRTVYRRNLQEGSLSKTLDVEQISRHLIIPALENATRHTTKGIFKKSHGADLIAELDIKELRRRSKHADRLFQTLQNHLGVRA